MRWISARLIAVFMVIVALLLLAGGGYLTWLGGSPYYLITGLLVLLSGIQLWRLLYAEAAKIYALIFAGTLVWAYWESGLDGWALAPRLIGPLVLGLFLLVFAWRPGLPKNRAAAAAAIAALILIPAGFLAAPISFAETAAPASNAASGSGDWPHYGNDAGGQRFSPLTAITPDNVDRLRVAWTYRIGMLSAGGTDVFEVTPLKIGDSLYLCGNGNDVVALDAETGRQRWRWNSAADLTGAPHPVCRGVAYYANVDPTGATEAPCAARVYTATADARLVALDARTGQLCAGFGVNGIVDLTRGMGKVLKGYYFVTSAPAVVRGRIVLGGWVTDGQHRGEPSGVIRAFDALTGELSWAWDMGRPGKAAEPGPGEEYSKGTPNSWAPISADETLGLVYLPTGNETPDYFGGGRLAVSEIYSSSVVAVDAMTGLPRWHFQTTHHDIWDYDVASQPTLLDVPTAAGIVPGLLQPTKRGELFLLDRRTGKPIAAVAERPVPTDTVPGEWAAPTQPFSVGMPSFGGPPLTEKRMWGLTPIDQLWCRVEFRRSRYKGTLTPIGFDWTIVYPGYVGGMDWGSVAVDPVRNIVIVPAAAMPNRNRLIRRAEAEKLGLRPTPGGKTPSYVGYPQAGTPYAAQAKPFLSPLGIPCPQPPYGMISAVDLKTRKLLWSRPLGSAEGSGPFNSRSRLPFALGTPLQGGAIATASGLTFIAATQDSHLRAIDSMTGRELWKEKLPAGGHATPMTYRSNRTGRQYLVIAAGGSRVMGTDPGDYIIAYALP